MFKQVRKIQRMYFCHDSMFQDNPLAPHYDVPPRAHKTVAKPDLSSTTTYVPPQEKWYTKPSYDCKFSLCLSVYLIFMTARHVSRRPYLIPSKFRGDHPSSGSFFTTIIPTVPTLLYRPPSIIMHVVCLHLRRKAHLSFHTFFHCLALTIERNGFYLGPIHCQVLF